jgi:hypothetical protein
MGNTGPSRQTRRNCLSPSRSNSLTQDRHTPHAAGHALLHRHLAAGAGMVGEDALQQHQHAVRAAGVDGVVVPFAEQPAHQRVHGLHRGTAVGVVDAVHVGLGTAQELVAHQVLGRARRHHRRDRDTHPGRVLQQRRHRRQADAARDDHDAFVAGRQREGVAQRADDVHRAADGQRGQRVGSGARDVVEELDRARLRPHAVDAHRAQQERLEVVVVGHFSW